MKCNNEVYMILTNGFNPDVRVYKEAKYLVSLGMKVTILCWDRKCENKLEEVVNGINIKRFHIESIPGTGIKQLVPYVKFLISVRKYLKDKKYSFLHCHDFDGILVGLFTKNKKKIIFDMHEIYNNYSYAKNILFKYIFKNILYKSDYIIYVNNEQIKDMNEKYKNKLVYLPNYPNSKDYFPIVKSDYNFVRINYIGCLRDYNSLISLAELSKKNFNLEVGFYGDGVAYNILKCEYGNSSCKIYGKFDGITQSGEIYRNTDILYCSYDPKVKNWKTAYPVKLYEAIITSTPIIVSDDTVAGEFVKDNRIGEVVKYGDISSIENATNKIIKNYNNYVKNINKIANKYDWNIIVKNLNYIYFNCKEGKNDK